MAKPRLILVLAVMALVIAIPSMVSAQPLPSHVLVGTAMIDGSSAPDGAVVTAWINGAEVKSTTVSDGHYALVVDKPEEGSLISFKVDGNDAPEITTWTQGVAELNLFATSEPVVPGRVVNIVMAELNDSGQSGTAALTELGPNTRVELSLSEGTLQSESVHIHLGQCETPGGVDVGLTSYAGGSGESTSMVAKTIAMLMDGNHYINNHEADNPGTSTACGNIPSYVAATVATAWAGLSQYLVDDRGMSLYMFTVDVQGTDSTDPVANCTGPCANFWPPLWTAGDPVAMDQPEFRDGANAEMLGTVEWEDGRLQATYNGYPLYYYFKDLARGEVYGQYGDWFLLAPQGTLLVGGTNVDPAGPLQNGQDGEDGDDGDDGDDGARGAEGPEGPEGTAGPSGSAGNTGPAGLQGAAGPAGNAGSAGIQGEDGGSGSALAIIALILSVVSLLGAGGVFFLRRGS